MPRRVPVCIVRNIIIIILLCSEMNNGNYYRNTAAAGPHVERQRDIKTILCAHFMHNE